MHSSPRQHRRSSFPHVQAAVAQPVGAPAGPQPTEPAVVPEGTAWLDKRQAVIVYTTAGVDPSASNTPTKVPIGPIIGGVLGGVFIVLLAGGFWWWWVANKPKESTEPRNKNKNLPEVAPGAVPLPVSYARSRPSAPGTASPASSTSHQPKQMAERGWTPPVVAGVASSSGPSVPPPARVAGGKRSASGASDAPLLSSRTPSGSSSRGPSPLATSPTKPKSYNPSKPSPLAASAAAPKWGQMPFVSSPPRSNEGHAMDVLSTSPNSITPLNKHLDVTRSPSNGMLSTDSHGSQGGDRMSMVSEASRYSQGPGAMSSDGGHAPVELGRQVSGEWGVAYDVEDDRSRPSSAQYGYGHSGGAYGGGQQEVMSQQQPVAGRDSAGYLDEELESYYRPRSGI